MTPEAANSRFHVIIVLEAGTGQIEACLAALMAQTLPPARVTIFDNTKLSDVAERVARAWPGSPVIGMVRSPLPLRPLAGFNRAASMVRDAEFIMLLDPDAVLAINALEQLAEVFARHPALGVLGCKVLDLDVETIRTVGLELTDNALLSEIGRGEPDRGQFRGLREVAGVATAAMAVRQEAWDELGGLDETFWPACYEGMDLCYRARAGGWRVAVACEATVTHFNPWSARRGDRPALERLFRNRALFMIKHFGWREWLVGFPPQEARWLFEKGNKGMRRIALEATMREIFGFRGPSS